MAIARDVAVSEGDAILPITRDLMNDAAGGEVFYHVYGPDGVYVTGYASPPLSPIGMSPENNSPELFLSNYRGEEVRVSRIREKSTIGTLTGYSAVTVWQNMSGRKAFARQLAYKSIILMTSLIITVASVVWFGINIGLRPVTDLQDAISSRTSDDLNEIKRPLPPELRGIVATLNALFGQVRHALTSRDNFISDAAHQLRNPVAGILSLSEAVRDAKTETDKHSRSQELVVAARKASRLTNQLLSFERAKGRLDRSLYMSFDFDKFVQKVCESNAEKILRKDKGFELVSSGHSMTVEGDQLLLSEALQNLIDNALSHGGPESTEISITVTRTADIAQVNVANNGKLLKDTDAATAFSRFGQVTPGEGSGLGLAIVAEIMKQHNGTVRIETVATGASITLEIPIVLESS